MRHWTLVLGGIVAVALVAHLVMAEPEGGEKQPAARAARVRPAGAPGGPRMVGGRRPVRPGLGGIPMPRVPDLTAEQRKQIAKLREDAMKEIRRIQERMYENVKKLLSPDQVKAFEEGRRRITHRGPDPGVILTDEQKKVFDDARARAAKAEGPQRGEIMKEAIKKIRASYTEEQKRQAEEFRPRLGGPRGDGPRRGGPDDRRGGPDR
jgi:Spy/CpxP family protein refolding chaperone